MHLLNNILYFKSQFEHIVFALQSLLEDLYNSSKCTLYFEVESKRYRKDKRFTYTFIEKKTFVWLLALFEIWVYNLWYHLEFFLLKTNVYLQMDDKDFIHFNLISSTLDTLVMIAFCTWFEWEMILKNSLEDFKNFEW